MNIVIIGSGAMGLLFYSQLSNLHRVSLLTRKQHMQPASVSVTAIDGTVQQHVYNQAQIADIQQAECILFCVKSFDIVNAFTNTLPCIAKNSKIILMHNGMGVIEELSQQLSIENPVYALLTTQASLKISPTEIIHTGLGTSELGLVMNNDNNQQQNLLTNILSKSIPNLTLTTTIKQQQWQKLAINCAINALTAIHNVPNGSIAQQQFTQLLEQLVAEVIDIARAEKIILNESVLLQSILLVIEKTKNNSSSMREDVRNSRKTEINYINGYIKQLGQKHSIPTPINTQLYEKIKRLQQNYLK